MISAIMATLATDFFERRSACGIARLRHTTSFGTTPISLDRIAMLDGTGTRRFSDSPRYALWAAAWSSYSTKMAQRL